MTTVTPSSYTSSASSSKTIYGFFVAGGNAVTKVVIGQKSDVLFYGQGGAKEVCLKLSRGVDEFFIFKGHLYYKKAADTYNSGVTTYGNFTASQIVSELVDFSTAVDPPVLSIEHSTTEIRLVITTPDIGDLGGYELILV